MSSIFMDKYPSQDPTESKPLLASPDNASAPPLPSPINSFYVAEGESQAALGVVYQQITHMPLAPVQDVIPLAPLPPRRNNTCLCCRPDVHEVLQGSECFHCHVFFAWSLRRVFHDSIRCPLCAHAMRTPYYRMWKHLIPSALLAALLIVCIVLSATGCCVWESGDVSVDIQVSYTGLPLVVIALFCVVTLAWRRHNFPMASSRLLTSDELNRVRCTDHHHSQCIC